MGRTEKKQIGSVIRSAISVTLHMVRLQQPIGEVFCREETAALALQPPSHGGGGFVCGVGPQGPKSLEWEE